MYNLPIRLQIWCFKEKPKQHFASSLNRVRKVFPIWMILLKLIMDRVRWGTSPSINILQVNLHTMMQSSPRCTVWISGCAMIRPATLHTSGAAGPQCRCICLEKVVYLLQVSILGDLPLPSPGSKTPLHWIGRSSEHCAAHGQPPHCPW